MAGPLSSIAAPAPTEPAVSKLSFFRQSGWMLIATTASGALMYAVHGFAGRMPKEEYGIFGALLQIVNLMGIPAVGLQLTFVQQTVSAVSAQEQRAVAGAYRSLLKGTFLAWLVCAVVVFGLQNHILSEYKITHPAALWVTVLLGLASLWSPIVLGALQGQQNFLWLGWASILNGLTRLLGVAVIVMWWAGTAAGAMSAALLGMAVALGIGAWHTRSIWRGETEPFQWLLWLKRVLPLTLGFGAATYMVSQDMLVVQRFFPAKETAYYVAAGMIGRGLFFFLAPLTAVMFPRVAHSAARSEKTSVLAQALGAAGLLGLGAAIFCSIFPELPLRIVYYNDPTFLQVAPLVRLFAWCMLPLALANVLINNLLARRRFLIVPWLLAIAVGYRFALNFAAQQQPQRFENVVWTLGIFSTLLLITCLGFTAWAGRKTQ